MIRPHFSHNKPISPFRQHNSLPHLPSCRTRLSVRLDWGSLACRFLRSSLASRLCLCKWWRRRWVGNYSIIISLRLRISDPNRISSTATSHMEVPCEGMMATRCSINSKCPRCSLQAPHSASKLPWSTICLSPTPFNIPCWLKMVWRARSRLRWSSWCKKW